MRERERMGEKEVEGTGKDRQRMSEKDVQGERERGKEGKTEMG